MENKVLNKLIDLKKEWDNCEARIEAINEELKPIIIERYKQLDYKEEYRVVREKIAKGKYYNRRILCGYVNWTEYFIDEDTGKKLSIDRCRCVLKDGVWSFGVFDIDDLIKW